MPQFTYEAINEAGNTIKGELEAVDVDAARLRLAGMGYIPVAVRKGVLNQGGGGFLEDVALALTQVKTQELILFTKQLKTMLSAGCPCSKSCACLNSRPRMPACAKYVPTCPTT